MIGMMVVLNLRLLHDDMRLTMRARRLAILLKNFNAAYLDRNNSNASVGRKLRLWLLLRLLRPTHLDRRPRKRLGNDFPRCLVDPIHVGCFILESGSRWVGIVADAVPWSNCTRERTRDLIRKTGGHDVGGSWRDYAHLMVVRVMLGMVTGILVGIGIMLLLVMRIHGRVHVVVFLLVRAMLIVVCVLLTTKATMIMGAVEILVDILGGSWANYDSLKHIHTNVEDVVHIVGIECEKPIGVVGCIVGLGRGYRCIVGLHFRDPIFRRLRWALGDGWMNGVIGLELGGLVVIIIDIALLFIGRVFEYVDYLGWHIIG